MVFRRRSGNAIPMGHKPRGRQAVQRFPGAGERPPQSEVSSGAPGGVLPTPFGATGLKPFLSGRLSVKRSLQLLTDRRPSPFFLGDGGGTPQAPAGFNPEQSFDSLVDTVDRPFGSGPLRDAADRAKGTGEFVKVRGRAAKKQALLLFKKAKARRG